MSTDTVVGITIGEVKGMFADLNEKLASESGQEWHEALKLFLKKQNPWPSASEAVATAPQAVVDSLKEMIAAGRYDWVNSDITAKRFGPETLSLGQEPKLFHFDRDISSEDAIAEMEKQGYRPATLGDLLKFGAENSEEQRKFPIVALGSVARVGGDRDVAYLGRSASGRSLDLYWFDDVWPRHCRFLAVRK
jgi:hypothetical protein